VQTLRNHQTRSQARKYLKELREKGAKISNLREALDKMFPDSLADTAELQEEIREKGYTTYLEHVIAPTHYGDTHMINGPLIEGQVFESLAHAHAFLINRFL